MYSVPDESEQGLEPVPVMVPEWDAAGGSLDSTPADLQQPGGLSAITFKLETLTLTQRGAAAAAAALLVVVLLIIAFSGGEEPQLDFGTPAESPPARVQKLLAQMTLDQKIAMMHGSGEENLYTGLGILGAKVARWCGDCPYGNQESKDYGKCMTGIARAHVTTCCHVRNSESSLENIAQP